jgi:hypothetical protein
MSFNMQKREQHAILTRQARVCASLILAAFLLSGCSNSTPPKEEQGSLDSKVLIPADLEPIITRLGNGGTRVLREEEQKSLETWLTKTVVKGRTTKDEVIGIFGKRFLDLDRPERDSIISIQYAVGGYGNETQLQFDFNPKTGVVTNWSLGHAICGFCPHVFVNDQRWRLEGKMLAGCVGLQQEGSDVLLLPRLQAHEGQLYVKLSNLAAELDYIDYVQLGVVRLDKGDELDVGVDGALFVWRLECEREARMQLTSVGRGELSLRLNPRQEGRVVVLEIRNTTAFENAMRDFVSGKSKNTPEAAMEVQFDGRSKVQIPPVGTKFCRRIVLAVPEGSQSFHLEVSHELWLVRRVWIGRGRMINADVSWQTPGDATGPTAQIAALLSHQDGRRLCLEPMQEAQLCFHPPEQPSGDRRLGYVLRMSGYYDFVRSPESR